MSQFIISAQMSHSAGYKNKLKIAGHIMCRYIIVTDAQYSPAPPPPNRPQIYSF